MNAQEKLPPAKHPHLSAEDAAKLIREHLTEASKLMDRSELCGLPTWDWVENEWRAVVKVTPWGPLVVAGFKMSGTKP